MLCGYFFQINPNGDHYNIGAYIRSAISYDYWYKHSALKIEGWEADLASAMDSTVDNVGWQERFKWFLYKDSNGKNYSKNQTKTFFGRLLTPLVSSSCPIPCGVKVNLNLTFAPPEFLLQTSFTDQHSYKYAITDLALFVNVGTLNEEVYHHLMAKWQLSKSPEKVRLHFRRFACNVTHIPISSTGYREILTNLGSEMPSRMILAFLGHYNLRHFQSNPFNFARIWRDDQGKSAYLRKIDVLLGGENLGNKYFRYISFNP